MDELTRTNLDNLCSFDRALQTSAYHYIMELTAEPVEWAYAVWDTLVEMLTDKDGHRRAIAGQVLSNLAISDPDNRMARDFEKVLAVTREPSGVAARHTRQHIWKIGLAGASQREMVMAGLEQRYHEGADEKYGTLARFDVIEGMKRLYDHVGDERIKTRALALIALETDAKYQKKYAALWREKTRA